MVYTVTFDLEYPEVNDSISVSVGGGSLFGIDVTQGLASYSIDVTAGATAQTVKFNLDMSTGGSIVYFDNIVVKEKVALPAYDIFGGLTMWGDGVSTWDRVPYADLKAKLSGEHNTWIKWEKVDDVCMIDEIAQYNTAKVLTPTEDAQNRSHFVQGDCGQGFFSFIELVDALGGNNLVDNEGNLLGFFP
jgi:hypothetical protein